MGVQPLRNTGAARGGSRDAYATAATLAPGKVARFRRKKEERRVEWPRHTALQAIFLKGKICEPAAPAQLVPGSGGFMCSENNSALFVVQITCVQ